MSFENVERSEGLSLNAGPGFAAVLTTPVRCCQRGYSPSQAKLAVMSRAFNVNWQDVGVTFADWVENANGLHKEFSFSDFSQAWGFMSRVAALAQELDHHPDWSNSWNRVSITLISHDVGRVTDRDRVMASGIDEILSGDTEVTR